MAPPIGLTKVTSGVRTLGTDEVTADIIKDDVVTNAKIKSDAAIAQSKLTEVTAGDLASTLDLSSKTVTLAAGAVTPHVPEYDDNALKEDIALLGFRAASTGSLAKYNLVDQTIDAFEDASGIDASASTDEIRNASNYYSGGVSASGATTGFTTTGANTWTAPTPAPSTIEVLVVGGGGGGGAGYYAGGGGAGGVVQHTSYSVTAGVEYDITVGAGGGMQGNDSSPGYSGSNSVFNVNTEGSGITLTANGGGGGGSRSNDDGAAGGSGGGGGDNGGIGGSSNQASFSGATSYGNSGATSNNDCGAGGGGAGAVGGGVTSNIIGGPGGAGKEFSSFSAWGTNSSNTTTGPRGYFAGGGAGASNGNYTSTTAAGGVGGGANGVRGANHGIGAQANTGGAGSGSGWTGHSGGAGGSGFVGIHYPAFTEYNDLTLVSNSTTAQAAPTKADLVMTYTNGAGTATINTDLKAYASRDNGTTWTQLTLASQGSTGAHTILSAHDLDISGQPSGTDMKYKITTHNQSVTKSTRIHAVSLGWS